MDVWVNEQKLKSDQNMSDHIPFTRYMRQVVTRLEDQIKNFVFNLSPEQRLIVDSTMRGVCRMCDEYVDRMTSIDTDYIIQLRRIKVTLYAIETYKNIPISINNVHIYTATLQSLKEVVDVMERF